MRADTLTENLDKKNSHELTSGQLLDIEQAGTQDASDFYRKSDSPEARSNPGRGQADVASDVLGRSVKNGEEAGNYIKQLEPPVTHQDKPAKPSRFFSKMKLGGKSSLFTVLVLLFGGGGFLTILFAPSAAIIEMKEIFTQSFNDQVKALDSRSGSVMRAKFKSADSKSCGGIKICKEFSEISDEEVKNFEDRNPQIKINRTDIVDGKGKIQNITFTEDGKAPLVLDTADKFSGALDGNVGFRAAWNGTVFNPTFESVSDPTARALFEKNKLSKNYDLTGQDDEERQKKLNSIVAGEEDLGGKNLTKSTDKDGKVTYTDESGQTYSQAQVDSATQVSNNTDIISKAGGMTGVIAGTAEKAVSADAVVENTCTTWNFFRHVSSLAKTAKKIILERYALALVLTLADKIKAGQAGEDEVNFAGNTIMKAEPDGKVIDDSKLSTTSTGTIPLIDSATKGGNAFDSAIYKTESSGVLERTSSSASKFSLTGGSSGVIDAVETTVAKAIPGANGDPKQISKDCGYVQNSFVRVGAFGLGLAIGAATFGIATAVQGGLSVAWAIAQPSLEASLADTITGDVTKNITGGPDSGQAVGVGTDALTSDLAQARGMAPVTDQSGIDYINQNRKTAQVYNQDQQYLARATPFDVTNRFSFLGSVVSRLAPTIAAGKSSASVAMMNMASLIPTTFASINQPVMAADTGLSSEYFNSCPDPIYKSENLKADPSCVIRHWMPQNSLALDPLDNAQWMSDTGNIDPDSDTGDPKDNGQSWNYVKFMAECVNRTQPLGENENENDGDGSSCYSSENEQLNMHFRTYTMDLSVNSAMKDDRKSTPISTGAGDNTKAKIGPNGWAFPTVASDLVTRQFGGGFTGVDIAGNSVALTNQQPIYAAKAGVVIAAGKQDGYGNRIIIQHDPDASGKVLYTVYGNIDDNGILVALNQKVSAGDQIAKIGSADQINGPHLRFEVWDGSPLTGGKPIDPTSIVEGARPVVSTSGGPA